MTYLNILRFLLLLLVGSTADRFQNDSDIALNRTRRLTHGTYNEETLRLAKFMVSIRTRNEHMYYGDNHFCSGVIISPRFVLTSAHCVIDQRFAYPGRILIVVAGTPNRLRYQEGRSFHAPVKSIIVSDNFTLRNEEDIGILILKIPFPRNNDYIAIGKLPYRSVPVGTVCSVVGWGRLYGDGPITAEILHINTEIIQPNRCAEVLNIKKKDLLCTMDHRSNVVQHPCDGDRGAPLIHGSTIYGIVGYILECNDPSLPSVYTDVYKNIFWIRMAITYNRSSICHVSYLFAYGLVLVHFLASFHI